MALGSELTTKKEFKKLEEFILSLPEKKGSLITVLHKAQGLFGYLPIEVQEFVAEKLDLPVSKVYGVVTFYSFFTMNEKGKYKVSVCMGTACYVRGAEKIVIAFKKELGLEVGETSSDKLFSLDTLRCVGACGLAPVVMINDEVYGKDKANDVKNLIKMCKSKEN